MNLDLVRRGHLVVEPKHLTHQGATSVALVVDAVHPSLRLFHHIEAIATMAYLLLPSLSIVDLAEGGVTAVPLIDLALLIRRDLDEVILVGRALLLLTVRHASLDLILLLVLTFLHLTAVAIDEVGIERLKILQQPTVLINNMMKQRKRRRRRRRRVARRVLPPPVSRTS